MSDRPATELCEIEGSDEFGFGISEAMLEAGRKELADYNPVHGYDTPDETIARIYAAMQRAMKSFRAAQPSEIPGARQ
jgi:hypothetical protein